MTIFSAMRIFRYAIVLFMLPALNGCNQEELAKLDSKTKYTNDNMSEAKTTFTPTQLGTRLQDKQRLISWQPVAGADYYRLYWANQPNVNQNAIFIDVNTREYLQEYILPYTDYYYRVSAWQNGKESPLSNEVTVRYSDLSQQTQAGGNDSGS